MDRDLKQKMGKRNEILFNATEEYTADDIKKVQRILLIMANHIHRILEKHGIKYYITFGTLLGAVRHQGFIPWDDDFDIFLFEEDYEYAMECLRKELPGWMIVHDQKNDPIYWPYWSRIRDLNTETYAQQYTDDNYYKYKGIDLDVYKLKKVKRNQAELTIYQENLTYLQRKHEHGILSDKLFNIKTDEVKKKIEEAGTRMTKEEDEIYYFIMLTKFVEPKDLFPLKRYKFEGYEYWGPNNPDSLLRQAYGNYMELPAVEKRQGHYKRVIYKDPDFDYENAR